MCPVLVASDQGCATLSGLRLLCEIIGVKGGLHLFQQRVRNKYRGLHHADVSPAPKSLLALFPFLQSSHKTHFWLYSAMCRWSGAKAIFHFMQLVKQPYGRKGLAALTLAHHYSNNISLSQGHTIFIFLSKLFLLTFNQMFKMAL